MQGLQEKWSNDLNHAWGCSERFYAGRSERTCHNSPYEVLGENSRPREVEKKLVRMGGGKTKDGPEETLRRSTVCSSRRVGIKQRTLLSQGSQKTGKGRGWKGDRSPPEMSWGRKEQSLQESEPGKEHHFRDKKGRGRGEVSK